jgi:hypothetical protein
MLVGRTKARKHNRISGIETKNVAVGDFLTLSSLQAMSLLVHAEPSYIDFNLCADPLVLIMQYDHTVFNKVEAFRRTFDLLGCHCKSAVIDGIFASSVGEHKWPGVDPLIQDVCDDLKAQFDHNFGEHSVDNLRTWSLHNFSELSSQSCWLSSN